MPALSALPAAPLARDPDPAGLCEVILIGSAGSWSRGRTLDAAYADANGRAPLGARVVIVIAPVIVGAYVDETGALRWSREHGGALAPRWLPGPGAAAALAPLAWPARRTERMRAAVDALTTDLAAVVADYVALPAE